MHTKELLDESYWKKLRSKSAFAGITLDESIDPNDFAIYGERLALKQIDFFKRANSFPIAEATVVDLGCGIGRVSKVLSKYFNKVIALDINERIIEAGKHYCSESNNINFIENDGKSIPLPDTSVEYIYCGGVLQHIKSLEVIKNYFYEGLRVLKNGGVLNYSIQTWMDDQIKGNNVGKMIKSRDIEEVINKFNVDIFSLIEDKNDPIPHLNIILIKKKDNLLMKIKRVFKKNRFNKENIVIENVRTGIWEDLKSYNQFRKLWLTKRRQVTFWH